VGPCRVEIVDHILDIYVQAAREAVLFEMDHAEAGLARIPSRTGITWQKTNSCRMDLSARIRQVVGVIIKG